MDNSLQYRDDTDKAYGLAGMTITLVALDGEEYLAAIDMDAPEVAESLRMSPVFGIKGNPRMSAKIIWEQAVRELRLTASATLGNLVCRRYLLGRTGLSFDERMALRRAVSAEAEQHCSLDRDEADALFDHSLAYVDRLFRHSGVQSIAGNFSRQLLQRRSMSAAEAFELLSSLGLQ